MLGSPALLRAFFLPCSWHGLDPKATQQARYLVKFRFLEKKNIGVLMREGVRRALF